MPNIVILSEAKNLIVLGSYAFEILRLTPQNDVVGQPHRGDLKDLSVLLHFPNQSVQDWLNTEKPYLSAYWVYPLP